jgi:VanZ family protein
MSFEGIDKVEHFIAFGLLATALVRTALIRRLGRWQAPAAIALVSLYGASDEIHQLFTSGRTCDVFDWIADTTGAAVAVSVYGSWKGYRNFLEWSPRRKPAATAAPALVELATNEASES